MKTSKVSLAQIALHSGVSIATVSRVVNGTVSVSPALESKVRSAMEDLGSLTLGRGTQKKKTQTFGYLTHVPRIEMASNENHQRYLHGIEAEVNALRGHLMFASYEEDMRINRLPLMVEQNLVSGLIIHASHTPHAEWLAGLGQKIPIVLLTPLIPNRKFSSVTCDDQGGLHEGISYLRDLGHEKIGFLSVKDVRSPSGGANVHAENRQKSFLQHAPTLGVEMHPEYVQIVERDWEKEGLEDAIRKAVDAWRQMGDRRPTAVICAHDIYASAFISEARKQGLETPRDFSVLGFMNTTEADHAQPPITSISVSAEEVGRAAVDLLDFHIRNAAAPTRHLLISATLVERLSCRRL